MKIILAPSKTQKTHPADPRWKASVPLYDPQRTQVLWDHLHALSPEEMGKMMHLKGTLLEETYALYHPVAEGICTTNPNPHHPTPALRCYSGVVLAQLQPDRYTPSSLGYMEDHLVILSALYGPLSPCALIRPYRFDLNMRLPRLEPSLYRFWEPSIQEYFKGEDLIVNLASEEFAKLLKKVPVPRLNIEFLDPRKDGTYGVISYNAKKARGQMADQLIRHRITDPRKIPHQNIEGYRFSKERSTLDTLVFLREPVSKSSIQPHRSIR